MHAGLARKQGRESQPARYFCVLPAIACHRTDPDRFDPSETYYLLAQSHQTRCKSLSDADPQAPSDKARHPPLAIDVQYIYASIPTVAVHPGVCRPLWCLCTPNLRRPWARLYLGRLRSIGPTAAARSSSTSNSPRPVKRKALSQACIPDHGSDRVIGCPG